jgi:hypothetical protein
MIAPAAALADGVQIRDAAARVVVLPEARRDVQVTTRGGDARLPPVRTRMEGDTVVVDGGLRNRIASCGWGWNTDISVIWRHPDPGPRGSHENQRVSIRGVGPLTVDQLPVITVRVPLSAHVAADGAVWGEVGPTDALSLEAAGCGDWRVADVRGRFSTATSGSGDVRARRAGSVQARLSGSGGLTLADVDRDADVSLSGSGDMRAGRIGGPAVLKIAGSGDIKAERIDGPVEARIGGSGAVHIRDGRTPRITVAVSGSGSFDYGGTARALDAQVAGSGDVSVARVDGPVTKAVAGSGEVRVGR